MIGIAASHRALKAKVHMGQYLPKLDVPVRSGFPLITTKSRTSRRVGDGPEGDISRGGTLGFQDSIFLICASDLSD
jgi:hypothetical protein